MIEVYSGGCGGLWNELERILEKKDDLAGASCRGGVELNTEGLRSKTRHLRSETSPEGDPSPGQNGS